MPFEVPKITIKAARVNAGLSQKEAAKLLGISVSTLQSYEKGKTVPDVHLMQRAERVYRYPSGNIFFDCNYP